MFFSCSNMSWSRQLYIDGKRMTDAYDLAFAYQLSFAEIYQIAKDLFQFALDDAISELGDVSTQELQELKDTFFQQRDEYFSWLKLMFGVGVHVDLLVYGHIAF